MKMILPLVIALAAMPAYAQLYKWTDADGKVHYSDHPQDGTTIKEIPVQRAAPAQPAAAADNWRQRELDSRAQRMHREQSNRAAGEAASRNAARGAYNPSMNRSDKPMSDEDVCNRDAQQIAYSESGKGLTFSRGNGTSATASEEERQAIIRQRKENHALLCGPGQRSR